MKKSHGKVEYFPYRTIINPGIKISISRKIIHNSDGFEEVSYTLEKHPQLISRPCAILTAMITMNTIIKKNSSILYDAEVVNACFNLFTENRFKFTD